MTHISDLRDILQLIDDCLDVCMLTHTLSVSPSNLTGFMFLHYGISNSTHAARGSVVRHGIYRSRAQTWVSQYAAGT